MSNNEYYIQYVSVCLKYYNTYLFIKKRTRVSNTCTERKNYVVYAVTVLLRCYTSINCAVEELKSNYTEPTMLFCSGA
jgi:hypothetical protein